MEFLVFISDCHFQLREPTKYLLHLKSEKPTRGLILQNPETYSPTSTTNCYRVFILISWILALPFQCWYLFLIPPGSSNGCGLSREQVTSWPLELSWKKYMIPGGIKGFAVHCTNYATPTSKCGYLIKPFGSFKMSMFLSSTF